jgi:uncharacterized protein (DUF488 family)
MGEWERRDLPMNAVYTIGYGGRTLEGFVDLLPRYEIEVLVDVRSQPYSRYQRHFSKKPLAEHLPQIGVEYLWMGDGLGGRPDDPACYPNGAISYERCQERPAYQEGIAHLVELARERRCAVMCSEGRPQACHRARLIGETLAKQGVLVLHIDENGELREHAHVMTLANGFQPGLPDLDG